MASVMRWLAVVLVGCALASAWARTIPTSRDHVTGRDPVTSGAPVTDSRDELRRDLEANVSALLAADAAYREFAVMDSLLPLLPDTPGVTLSLSPALRSAVRDSLALLAALEMANVAEPRGRAGVFVVDNMYGRRRGIDVLPRRGEREIYVGSDSAGAFCAMVGTGWVGHDGVMANNVFGSVRLRRQGVLGPCRFIVRYGAPGPQISRWLEEGAYARAEVPGAAQERRAPELSRELMLWTAGDLRMRGCVGGRNDMCAAVFATVERPAREAGAATFNLPLVFDYAWSPYHTMLSDLEARFGPEHFAQFWTSGSDVPVAFASAFGVSVHDWVREWGQSSYGEQRLGPGVSALTVLLAAALLLLFAGLGVARTARRDI